MAVKKTTTKAKAATAPAKTTTKPLVKSVKKVEVEKDVKKVETTEAAKPNKLYLVVAGVIVLLGLGLYFGRGLFVAAVVNGQPISCLEVVQQTEKQKGKETLNTLITNILVDQEAQKQKVTVSDKELDDEMKKLEQTMTKQGQNLDNMLSLQGLTRTDLRKFIRLQKLVTKLVGKDVKVTDKEVNEYIEKNKGLFPEGQDMNSLKPDIKERLTQEKVNEKIRAWLDALRKKSKVVYFVQY